MSEHVAGWGNNETGEIGSGYKGHLSLIPRETIFGTEAVQIQASGDYSMVLRADGSLVGVGGNKGGQLLDGTFDNKLTVTVSKVTGVKQFATGGNHVIVLLNSGAVVTGGMNTYGTIGNGSTNELPGDKPNVIRESGHNSAVPVTLSLDKPVKEVAAGGGNCGVVFTDGSVAIWGENQKGQIGDGTLVNKPVPTMVKGLPGPVKKLVIGGVATEPTHSLALLENGEVWGWGAGGQGQLGPVPNTKHGYAVTPVKLMSEVKDIEAGTGVSYLIDTIKDLYVLGQNTFHQLGLTGESEEAVVTVPRRLLGDVVSVTAGERFALAVLFDGYVMVWGKGEKGALGDGTEETKPVPVLSELREVTQVAAGENHALALLSGPVAQPKLSIQAVQGGLVIGWEAPTGSKPWRVQWRKRGTTIWTKTQLAGTASTTTITGLLRGVEYEVSVESRGFGSLLGAGTAA